MWLETAWDIFSLGMSIVDVCRNPTDPLAWAGLAGDAIDVLVPCFGGLGETVKGTKAVGAVVDTYKTAKTAEKIDDATDAITDAAKTAKKLDELRDGAKAANKSGFSKWLSKGKKNYKVYRGIDESGNIVYVGITKQSLPTRLSQHKHRDLKLPEPKKKNLKSLKDIYENITEVGGLTRNEARALEQYYINLKHYPKNFINSIKGTHRYSDEASKWAKNFISVFG